MRTKKIIEYVNNPDNFRRYLEAQPEDRIFDSVNVKSCPLRCYGNESRISRLTFVLDSEFCIYGWLGNTWYRSPHWMALFVHRMIAKCGRRGITKKQALSILEDITGGN